VAGAVLQELKHFHTVGPDEMKMSEWFCQDRIFHYPRRAAIFSLVFQYYETQKHFEAWTSRFIHNVFNALLLREVNTDRAEHMSVSRGQYIHQTSKWVKEVLSNRGASNYDVTKLPLHV